MKNFYLTQIFLLIGLFASGQTTPTGSSTEVGVTQGELSVSLSGAANYNIPIAVPPGINGVVPKVSLAYNSQGDNGVAGYGWNISGLSSIKRIPSTKFHDGISDPVDFDNLDRFSLDGQRLIIKSGTSGVYGSNEIVYETENFSNTKITSYGVHPGGANYGPSYFKVEYPDGSKAIYGNSIDSRSITDWAITYWENAQGVRISYTYALANNILNITTIKYSARLDGTPINEIQFVYKARLREEHTYTGGQLFIRNTVLSDIKVLGNGVGYRNYNLTHDTTSLFYERLKSITEKSGDNTKSYNPTIFEYENTEDTISMLESFTALSVNSTPVMPEGHIIDKNAENGGDDTKILGDFGMDNKFGLITFSSNAQKRSSYTFYPNIDSNTTSVVGTKIYTKSIFDEIFLVNSLSGNASSGYKLEQNQNWCVARTDGNSNLTTFSIFSNNSEGNSPVKLEHEINYTFPMYFNESISNSNMAYGAIKTYLSGDFNGDKITDVIIIEGGMPFGSNIPYNIPSRTVGDGDIRIGTNDTSGGGVYFVNLDPRAASNAVNFAGRLSGEFRKTTTGGQGQSSFFAADIDGDGKTDIVVTNKNVIDIYSLNNANTFVKVQTITIPVSNTGYSPYLWPALADYNGDGRIDYGPKLFSDGISFTPSDNPSTPYNNGSIGKFIDFNSDGATDIFSVSSLDRLNLKFASVTNLFPLPAKELTYDYGFNTGGYTYSMLVNKNTMSKNQVVLFKDAGTRDRSLRYLVVNKDSSKDKLLRSVTLGNGVKETITYSSLTNGNGVYTANVLTENYPNQDIVNAPELKVVSKIEKQSKSQYKKQLFFYSGAVTNLDGLGFLGFYSTVRTNWHDDNSQIISYISKNDISQRGVNVENYEVLGLYEPLRCYSSFTERTIVKKDYTVTGSENLIASQSITLDADTVIESESDFSASINEEANAAVNTPTNYIKKTLSTYESDLLANKVFKFKNISNKQFDALQNISTETAIDYDEYNNPKKIVTFTKEGGTTLQTSVTNIVYETPKVSPYIVGRSSSKIQNVSLGGSNMATEELYEYDSNQLLSQIKKKGDATTNYVTENNWYDVFGNIIKKIVKAGSDSRETSYEYDSSGRFLNKSIDIEKLATTFQYNTNGTLKSKTNPFLQTTLYDYDEWFKKTKETDYLGNKIVYKYLNNLGGVIFTKTSDDGTLTEDTFDDLGRKTKSGAKNIMGSFSYVSYLYDIQDRNFKVSEPYIGAAPSQWNETKFDEYGRIFRTIAHTFKTVDITYSGLTTQIYDGTKNETYVKDALGNVISKFDKPDNIIKYTYFPNGSLKESNYGGVKTIVSLDGWGRKSQFEDPSAGIFKYKYNDFGELTSEENKNGITTYKLSSAGKVIEKTIIGGTDTNSKTTYTYDDTAKLLVSSKFEDLTNGTNTITTEYTYDPSQRISKKLETTPYAVFTKDFKYDSFGRLLAETSTAARLGSGKSSVKNVKYTYQNGSQYQIFDNDTNALLWQTNAINARGQLLSAQNGPTTITNTYDPYGYTLQLKYDKTASSVNIVTLNTAFFDVKKGNLDSRSNSLFAWNESFKYDSFDRLTEYTNSKGVQETQSYDDKGRITQNSLGTYNYAVDKPYQNSSISVTPEASTYYTAKPTQNISYNTFKSPVLIDEKGIDKISFEYNDDNGRTAMFYGDLQDEKLKRPYHKYYSADGSMEIKENIKTGVFDFVTYIGGDGYSAPIAVKSDGLGNQKYLYLQRDYQGSIVAITDQSGTVIEKRLFDAWGGIVKVQDGTGNTLTGLSTLDRGYTGHEHLQSVGIINMNGRLYDPKLHRFLQPDNNIQDPFNTQNYNRYGYVLNNPLKYIDPSGESIFEFVLGLVFSTYVHGAAASGGQLNPFKWDSSAWISSLAGTASSVGSYSATTGLNSYVDNYNNKPPQGASAISSGKNDEFIHNYVSTKESNPSRYNNEAFGYAGLLTTGLIADDVTGVGVADDVLIPVAWGAATTVWVWDNREVIKDDAREIVDAIHRSLDPRGFHYVTYTKTSLDGSKVYVGRSSGYGTPEQIVKNRDANHHIDNGLIKYGPAELSSSLPATKPGGYSSRLLDSSYWAIRGSEQLQIDYWRSKNMSGNIREGIGAGNENITKYINWGIRLLY
ncbi:RHS repeat-associated core domain-containing protein [uncultured Flavobacterium sp.]|uniref:RHS repeat-associated core domain-containing protein n=1 Tax=uncultured Flavobacterium sp. TaxID=165435 RepID=UPI00292D7675|nr:RHS repeat-associated core domain-containing protein [uncultured Flavobacterium sp.]